MEDRNARRVALERGIVPDAIADALLRLGAESVDFLWRGSPEKLAAALGEGADISEPPTFKEALGLLQPAEGSTPSEEALDLFWDGTLLDVVWSGLGVYKAVGEVAEELLGSGTSLTAVEQRLEDDCWIAAVRQECYPRLLGRIVLAHTQHTPSDVSHWMSGQSPAPLLLTLEVGASFGFGDHPTTRLCMGWLQEQDLHGKTLLDYGCGTGVLGLSAKLLGAGHAAGVDCDLASLRLAQANAVRNGLDLELFVSPAADAHEWQCVSFFQPSEGTKGLPPFPVGPPTERRFDVAVANMTPTPLSRVAGHLAGSLAPGGLLAVSGLREEAVAEVTAVYAKQGVDLRPHASEEGWVCLAGRKTGP